MPEDDATDAATQTLKPGQRLYGGTGREVGGIQGISEVGVEVNVHGDVETTSLRHVPGMTLGEGYLLWRCSECGEVGDIEQLPDRCPFCGAVLSDGGAGFVEYIEEAPLRTERFDAWQERIREDIGGEWGG